MITEYEFHKKCKMILSDIIQKLNEMGYTTRMKLSKDDDGDTMIELHLMNGDGSYIKSVVDLYKDHGNMYEYEFKTLNRSDFMKLHDIMANLPE